MQSIDENARLAKAIGTEESVINLIEQMCRKFGWTYRSRVIPPSSSMEEIDILLFTEKVILIIEVKRWSGLIMEWSEQKLTTEDQYGALNVRKNPLIQLRKKRDAVSTELSGKWWFHERCAAGRGDEKPLPIRSVVVFGDSTILGPNIENSNPLQFNELAIWEHEVKVAIPKVVSMAAATPVQGLPRTAALKSFGWRCRGVLLTEGHEVHHAFLDLRKCIDLGTDGVAMPHQIQEIIVTKKNGVRARLFGSQKEFTIRNEELVFNVIGKTGFPEELALRTTDLDCFMVRAFGA